jgi:tetratricopeptide (TPR) repeat protein
MISAIVSAELQAAPREAPRYIGLAGTDPCRRRLCRWLALACLVAPASSAARLYAAEPPGPPDYTRAFYRGEYSQAIALATEILKDKPTDVPARIVHARAEAALGRFDAAFEGFREALRLAPHDPDALYYVGVTAGVLAQLEYERLLTLAPGSARAHQLLGESLEAQGRSLEAEAEYEAALEVDPGSVEVLAALGDLARTDLAQSKERFAEARAYYSRALERAPDNYDALYGLGACDAFADDHAKAVQLFRRALGADPDSAPVRLGLGISLLQTGQAAAAVTELETAAGLEPRMREAWYHLGRAYQALGRSREAELAFARVQELLREEREALEAAIEDPDRR